MALGPEHHRRLRRPARPRLRRVLRDRRVHDGLVRLGLLRARQRRGGHPHPRRRASRPTCPGIHFNFLHRAGARGHLHDDRGHAHRPADAAPARRLHRDRDARVRRDHRPPRGQRRRASIDLGGHAAHRPAARASRRWTRSTCRSSTRSRLLDLQTVVLVRARPGGDRAVRELPAARLAARPRVDRAARGRGRRGRDGRPGRQDEAAGLRHRRRLRRHRRARSWARS